uniref:Uncharacterized protein n=1 Tax=Anopheles christyi TaxID=43041 RepID=A0A182KHU4_9DIPT
MDQCLHRWFLQVAQIRRRLSRLLAQYQRVNIYTRQPASKPGMRMVPSDHHFRPSGLLQHVQHFRLKHGIDRFD